MIDKVKHTFAYDIIHKTFVQAIRKLHCAFLCGIPEIVSVWKFDGRIKFFQVKIICKDILEGQISLDGDWSVPVKLLLDWIEVYSITYYITCLRYVNIFLKLMRRSIPLYNIVSTCFVVFCNNCSIPVVYH